MKLTILTPAATLLERQVAKVTAEAPNGFFCLLPRHVDFVTAIVPGVLSFTTEETTEEVFVAVDEGVLVKQGADVTVSTRNAATGEALERLEERVARQFRRRDAEAQKALQALNKIEAGFVRCFLDIQHGA